MLKLIVNWCIYFLKFQLKCHIFQFYNESNGNIVISVIMSFYVVVKMGDCWHFVYPRHREYDNIDIEIERCHLPREYNGRVSRWWVMNVFLYSMIGDINSVLCQIPLPPTVRKVRIFIKKLNRQGRSRCQCLITVSDPHYTPGCYVRRGYD